MMKEFKKDQLLVKQYATRQEMGAGAAADAEKVIAQIIAEKGEITMIDHVASEEDIALLLKSFSESPR